MRQRNGLVDPGKAMQRMRTIAIIVVTALITSLFWIVVYNGVGGQGVAATPATARPVVEAAAAQPPGFGPPSSRPAPAIATSSYPAAMPLVMTPSGLVIPVVGKAQRDLVDTFTASRSNGRVHNAIDIMAARGTPVVSAAAGTVEKLHQSALGGITAYVRSDDGQWVYYYAHLDSYAPGLAEGQHLRQGDPIGQVGFTGNASPAGPHLHFGVYRMAPGQRWYQGTAINPYPMLVGGR
jgi:peptidoglycan LD-endopeptidase LytH